MEALWLQVLPVLGLLVLGYGVGRWVEHRHLLSLEARELGHRGFVVTNLRMVPSPETVRESYLVLGEAVIATDYFKSFAARLRSLVGGEIRAYNTLMTRARREALLRMLDQARQAGSREVYNVRYETSNIRSANPRNPGVSVEVFAFGTAVVRQPAAGPS
ncbi:MAG: heavy metal-binding domain-containing protein [Phycisphaerae bacterium]|nr:heavy metal-binding domain-containing protein [Phycisphaerae bacterium]